MRDTNALKHSTSFINPSYQELDITSYDWEEDFIAGGTCSSLGKSENVSSDTTSSHEFNVQQHVAIVEVETHPHPNETDHNDSIISSNHFNKTNKDINSLEKSSSELSLHYEQFFMLNTDSEFEDWTIVDLIETYGPLPDTATKATQTEWEDDDNTYEEVVHELVLKKFSSTLERFKSRSFKRKQRRCHTADFDSLESYSSLEPKSETSTVDSQNGEEYKYDSKQLSENVSSTFNVSIKMFNTTINQIYFNIYLAIRKKENF